jgi:DnaJ-class molecular chaperone
MWLEKGYRVHVKEWKAKLSSLSGMQMKFGADLTEFRGTVRHIRCDDLDEPKTIHVWVEPDSPQTGAVYCERCKVSEVEVDQRAIVAILKPCETCKGKGRVGTGLYDEDGRQDTEPCPDCYQGYQQT